MSERKVHVAESGNGPYGQFITSGRHVLGADEPEALGGKDTGPDPYELVLAGLGACTAMTIRMYASRKKWPLRRIEVQLRHLQRATAGKDLKDKFERVVTLEGDLTEEQRRHLLDIADRCPVSQTLKRSSDIDSTLADGPAGSLA
ncbi:MAG: OsmC family protein [Hyphomicrobiaceae bacterium]